MIGIEEVHIRLFYMIAAVGVLALLRPPLQYPEKPGSKWFAITICSIAVWLAGVGLYYFVHSRNGSLLLYSLVLFAITVCFIGWLLIAIEFATGQPPPRVVLVALGGLAGLYALLLATNYLWVHELVYQETTFVDEGGGLNPHRGPVFWLQMSSLYVLVFVSTVLFVAEWINATGPRRRQAGLLACTPLVGMGVNLLWFAAVIPFPFDPTPIGVAVAVAILGWALYRADFLAITTIATGRVVEEMPDAVVILDGDDRVVKWNRVASELFDVPDPNVGMPADSFFQSVPDAVRSRLSVSTNTDRQVSLESDGRTRHFSVSTFSIDGGSSGSLGRVVVVNEITDMKKREAQLRRQNEQFDAVTEIISHDLQSPLLQIRASAEALTADGSDARADAIRRATDRIDDLVSDLSQLAHAGRQLETETAVDLGGVAERTWASVWSPHAELMIETDLTIRGDPARIQQLLENCFRNAVEHASTVSEDRPEADAIEETVASMGHSGGKGGGSQTRAETTADGDGQPLTVTVGSLPDGFYLEDTGSGFPSTSTAQLFEKGYTTSSTGSGIGLNIVEQIADAHGWSVRATNGETGGARLEFTGVEVA